MNETKRQRKDRLLGALRKERASFDPRWRDVGAVILPGRTRFNVHDARRGDANDPDQIINNAASRAANTLAAGMRGAIMSPIWVWFRLATPDPELMEHGPVREWLHIVQERMIAMFAGTNLYTAADNLFLDLGGFGTHCTIQEEDAVSVLRYYPQSVGAYFLACNARGAVDTIVREISMTVRQVVEKFGNSPANVSPRVRDAYTRGDYQQGVDVVHEIAPNYEMEPGRLDWRGKAYTSTWFERGDTADRFLREAGMSRWPGITPRWGVSGDNAYASQCPGLDALGDAMAIQTWEKWKAQGQELLTRPPLNVPGNLSTASMKPGAINRPPLSAAGTQKVEPTYNYPHAGVGTAAEAIVAFEQRLYQTFHADLLRLQADANYTSPRTAEEIRARTQEKMQQLGPVYERVNDEALRPIIDFAFSVMEERRMFPPAPRELAGIPIKAEFQNVMVQAHRATMVAGTERLLGIAGNLSASFPEVKDKLDVDEAIDEIGAALGVKPAIVRSDEQVAKIRDARAKQAEQDKTMAQVPDAVKSAQLLSQTDVGRDSALTRILPTLGPAAGAAVSQ